MVYINLLAYFSLPLIFFCIRVSPSSTFILFKDHPDTREWDRGNKCVERIQWCHIGWCLCAYQVGQVLPRQTQGQAPIMPITLTTGTPQITVWDCSFDSNWQLLFYNQRLTALESVNMCRSNRFPTDNVGISTTINFLKKIDLAAFSIALRRDISSTC